MKKIVLSTIVASSVAVAGGYKIPEASLNAVALSAANIAHVKTADAAYYNPANMVFMSDENHLEADMKYIGLDSVNYKGKVSGNGPYDLDSESEDFLVPSLHYVSGKLGNARVGVSLVSPGGLSKRWSTEPAKTSAEEFTLEVIEFNPTVALPVTDTVAVAFGFRIVHSSGVVKSDGTIASNITASRDMTGDSTDFGYNLALSYKPTKALEFGLTYRSRVNLTEEGDAKLDTTHPRANPTTYNGDAEVSVPLPATFSAAIAYTLPSATTIEFVYENTQWSAYENLEFSYDGSEGTVLSQIFGSTTAKDWKDSNTYRLGITQEFTSMTLMGGVVYDESPVPDSSLSFELPDSNSLAFSLGGRYHVSDKLDLGLAALYSTRESRTADNDSLDGEFTDGNVLIVSMGIGYRF